MKKLMIMQLFLIYILQTSIAFAQYNLFQNSFELNSMLKTIKIQFKDESNYEFSYYAECGGWTERGKYIISNGIFYLYPLKYYELNSISCEKCEINNPRYCYREKKDNSFIYSEYIVCKIPLLKECFDYTDVFEFPIEKTKKFNGYETKINNMEIEIFNIKYSNEEIKRDQYTIITYEDIQAYEMPSIDSKKIEYNKSFFKKEFKKLIPKETSAVLLAKSKNEYTINSKKGYWCFIKAGYSKNEGMWIFGNFGENFDDYKSYIGKNTVKIIEQQKTNETERTVLKVIYIGLICASIFMLIYFLKKYFKIKKNEFSNTQK